jgi:hypothetical protein
MLAETLNQPWVSTGRRDGKAFHHGYLFMDIQRTSRCDTTLRTSPTGNAGRLR